MANITVEILTDFANKFAAKVTDIFAKKTDIPEALPADGGDANTVNGHTVNADVPAGAKFTDTKYTHPTTAGNKHIPAGGASGQILRWSADGTAVWGNDNNTTYNTMTGASETANGSGGLVPAPGKGAADRYLCSDGTFKKIEEATTADIDKIIAQTFQG